MGCLGAALAVWSVLGVLGVCWYLEPVLFCLGLLLLGVAGFLVVVFLSWQLHCEDGKANVPYAQEVQTVINTEWLRYGAVIWRDCKVCTVQTLHQWCVPCGLYYCVWQAGRHGRECLQQN